MFAADQIPAETEPLSTGEIEVKSLPPSNADRTILTAVFEPQSPVDPALVPEPNGPEGEPFDTGVVEPQSPLTQHLFLDLDPRLSLH